MIAGSASGEGTARYAGRFTGKGGRPPEAFRPLGDVRLATVGLGTYLGPDDDTTDASYRRSVRRALEVGLNVIDTAVNYRHQRSERAIGAALAEAVRERAIARDEVLVATKGGFIPFDGSMPRDPGAYVARTYRESGIVGPGDVVGGQHCMTPRYLKHQLERSRANLGLATVDVYYLHNPESQLDEIDRPEFMRRIREAFVTLEEAVAAGAIRWYGTATWKGYREDPTARGYLSLSDMVGAAREIGGEAHHFRVIQVPYNLAMPEAFTLANQKINGVMVSTLEAARRLGLYVMASASVYQGQLTRNLPAVIADFLPGLATDAQRALQFVRSTPGIGTALVGMKSTDHVEENAGAASIAPLPWEQFKKLFSEAT